MIHTFASKADAQRWLAATETDIARGDWHDPRLGEQSFATWAEHWLTAKTPHLASSTAALYRHLLREHITAHFGSWQVDRIRTVHVHEWLAELHSTNLSPNTVVKAYRLLKGVLGGAVDAGLLPRDPCAVKGAGTERCRHPDLRRPLPGCARRPLRVTR